MPEAGPLIFVVLLLGLFWFLVFRPARTQQKKQQRLQQELAVGQEVVMSSGIFGTIRSLGDARAEIEVAPGTILTVARQVVVRRVEDLPEEPAATAQDADDAAVDADEPHGDRPERHQPGPGAPGSRA